MTIHRKTEPQKDNEESKYNGASQSDDKQQSGDDTHRQVKLQKDIEESQYNGASQSDDYQQTHANTNREVEQQKDFDESQNNRELEREDKHQNKSLNENKPHEENKELLRDYSPYSNGDSQNKNKGFGSKETKTDEEHTFKNTQTQRCQQLGNNIPKAVERIKRNLERSTHCSPDCVKKVIEVTSYLDSQTTDNVKQNEADATCGKTDTIEQQMLEPDVEHVLLAVAPTQLLKDFHQEKYQPEQFDDYEITDIANEAIFDICIYIPQKLTWYYFGEGKNKGKFMDMGESNYNISTSNICILDNLCCVSQRESNIYMYSLTHCQRDGEWSLLSYDVPLSQTFNDFPRSRAVQLSSRDGKKSLFGCKDKCHGSR